MKIEKKQGIIIVLVVVAFIALFNIPKTQKGAQVLSEKQTYVTYLLYEDVLVEVATQTNKKKIEKQIEEAIYYMQQKVSPFTSLLKEDTHLEAVNIKDGVAILDFSVLTYEDKEELHVVESLVRTATQFPQVDSVKLLLQGQALTHMPINNTPLVSLTRAYGINHMESNQTYLHQGYYCELNYEINVEKETYPVTKSVKIPFKEDYEGMIDLLLQSPPVGSALMQPIAKYKIRQEKPCEVIKKTLHIYLSKEALDKKTGIKKEVVSQIQAILHDRKEITSLSFHVNGEVIAINGKNKIKR